MNPTLGMIITTLLGSGMYAAAFFLGKRAILRLLRRKYARFAQPPTATRAEWQTWITENVPLTRRLPAPQLERLIQRTYEFLDAIAFEGCNGLEVDDEMRVTIAAQACLLTLAMDRVGYAEVDTVLVYPSTFFTKRLDDRRGRSGHKRVATLGQAWTHGVVILSWDSVAHGAENPFDGQNVVFHEFAHQLDMAAGEVDGRPALPTASAVLSWSRVLNAAYHRLRRDDAKGRRTVMDKYGTSDPAEFFAVATEAFFEKGRQLKRKHPALYAELSAYYLQDPASGALGGQGETPA